MGKTVISDHPLIKHKIAVLRDVETDTQNFRTIVEELAMMLGYEALRDLPTKTVKVTTPITETMQQKLDCDITIVPILRAGLGMVGGLLSLVPYAKVGHIGLARDEETHKPYEYYVRLPHDIAEQIVILPDPMLATGGSAIHAVDYIKAQGCKKVIFICLIAAPEGLEALRSAHPDIDIYVGSLDEGLNKNSYIVPGLGDAGDRIFGTL